MGSPRVLLGGPVIFYLIQKVAWYILLLTVKSSEEIGIPWSFRLLAGIISLACLRLLRIDQVVGVLPKALLMTKGPSQGAESLCWPAVRWISRRDRKSTRLNSSHAT